MQENSYQPPVFGLAPMEGVSELPFRLWISQTSAPAFSSTPFLRATDTFPRALPPEFAPELDRYRELVNYRLIPQVMAARAEDFVRTARLFHEIAPNFVDLNAGCPSPNPISGGAGSGLLKDAARFGAFMGEIAATLPARSFSLKMRTGFEDHECFSTYLDHIAPLPLAQLTVHGRTRRDRYDHSSRWDLIDSAARSLAFPVVASGDIVSLASWEERRCHAEALSGVIIGRGAMRNPWIFQELREGRPVLVTTELLQTSFACLGLWLEAYHKGSGAFDALIRSGCFRSSCGSDPKAWRELYARSVAALRGQKLAPEELAFERTIMGRLKMVWNAARSSLPLAFFSPLLLRAQSFAEWIHAWSAMWESDRPLPIAHAPQLDWLFTSSRRKETPSEESSAD